MMRIARCGTGIRTNASSSLVKVELARQVGWAGSCRAAGWGVPGPKADTPIAEASKLVMSYVAAVSSKGEEVDKVKEQLLQSNPVLEGECPTHPRTHHPPKTAPPGAA